jgi:hypothetical protein
MMAVGVFQFWVKKSLDGALAYISNALGIKGTSNNCILFPACSFSLRGSTDFFVTKILI